MDYGTCPTCSWRIDRKRSRLLDYAGSSEASRSYYGGRFELVYQQASIGSRGLLKQIRVQHGFWRSVA
jgi:hypothetical protein